MLSPPEIRDKYGKCYCTILPDGTTIPWKPLSLEDYLSYSSEVNRGVYCLDYFEDEIFRKCVLDDTLVRQIDYLKAGTVHTVSTHIWDISGPVDAQMFSVALDDARMQLDPSATSSVYHSLVNIVTTAFPYTPEDVYSMDYRTFIMRVAMAESKLITMGVLQEPLQIFDPTAVKKKKKKVNLKDLWEKQHIQQTTEDISDFHSDKWWDESPVLEAASTHGIDFNMDGKETDIFGLTGHEKADLLITRHQMVEDAKKIYGPLLDRLDKQKKKE